MQKIWYGNYKWKKHPIILDSGKFGLEFLEGFDDLNKILTEKCEGKGRVIITYGENFTSKGVVRFPVKIITDPIENYIIRIKFNGEINGIYKTEHKFYAYALMNLSKKLTIEGVYNTFNPVSNGKFNLTTNIESFSDLPFEGPFYEKQS